MLLVTPTVKSQDKLNLDLLLLSRKVENSRQDGQIFDALTLKTKYSAYYSFQKDLSSKSSKNSLKQKANTSEYI